MRKTYTLNVAGVTRELPLCPVNEKMDIAAFIMFSDVEAYHCLCESPFGKTAGI